MGMRAILGATVMAGVVTFAAPAVSATTVTPMAWGYVRSEATNLCLQYQDFDRISTGTCQGYPVQTWEWQRSAYPEWGMLRNQATGECLDADLNGNVYINPCNVNNTYQWWARQPERDIRHGASGRYLDSNAAGNVYTLPRNGSAYQRWS